MSEGDRVAVRVETQTPPGQCLRAVPGGRRRRLGTTRAASEVVAALTLLREQGAHAEAISLARHALDHLKGNRDTEVEWISALLQGDQASRGETRAKKAKARR